MRVLSIETDYEEYFTWEEGNPSKRLSNVRYIVDVEHVMGGHFVKSGVEVPASKFDEDSLTADSMKDYLLKLFNRGDKVMGEEVRKKQLYKVEVPDPEKKSQARVNGLMRTEDNRINIGNINKEAFRTNRENVCLTEEEIKRNHSYLWEFAEPVEEPKYIVPLKGLSRDGRQVFLIKDAIYRSDNLDWSKEEYLRYNVDDYALTEEEIKNIDWAYWDFAVPVDVWLEGVKD